MVDLYSGRFTDISGHPSTTDRAQDRESSPAKDRRSTTEPRNQPCGATVSGGQCSDVWISTITISGSSGSTTYCLFYRFYKISSIWEHGERVNTIRESTFQKVLSLCTYSSTRFAFVEGVFRNENVVVLVCANGLPAGLL